jgi:glycine/D-amino acid oxidase-like deaminating enzyme/nitrite reductase/ring-hydroxylating ferredoxin subunit
MATAKRKGTRKAEKKKDEGTISVWMDTADVPAHSKLVKSTQADVCVVGAGIAGMTIAYLLGREGKSVVVLDHGCVGGGMTERTTAHLSNAIDAGYAEIEWQHGEDGARFTAESHTAAIDCIEAIIAKESIACDFERLDGYLFDSPGHSNDALERELRAVHRAGLTDVESVDRVPIDSFHTGQCLRFPRQAQFHPLKYLAGLALAIARDGGKIFTDTHVSNVNSDAPLRVETSSGLAVSAQTLVIATNPPIHSAVMIHTKQSPYTTYVIAARVPRHSVPRALYWDTDDPYHYVRLQDVPTPDAAHDLLIVGGEDHRSGQHDNRDERLSRLESWARERFPMMQAIELRWSGQVMESVDGLAFIGRNPEDPRNIYIATGDSGMGLTHGTIAGLLITDLIMGRQNPWAALYDPARMTPPAFVQFARDNLSVARQFVEDHLTGGDVDSAGQIAPGDGAVIRRGLNKMAVYRDRQGALHERSALCPHLGCIVGWNRMEKSWDCPCHGSRFDCRGRVIGGPATSDLAGVDDK